MSRLRFDKQEANNDQRTTLPTILKKPQNNYIHQD